MLNVASHPSPFSSLPSAAGGGGGGLAVAMMDDDGTEVVLPNTATTTTISRNNGITSIVVSDLDADAISAENQASNAAIGENEVEDNGQALLHHEGEETREQQQHHEHHHHCQQNALSQQQLQQLVETRAALFAIFSSLPPETQIALLPTTLELWKADICANYQKIAVDTRTAGDEFSSLLSSCIITATTTNNSINNANSDEIRGSIITATTIEGSNTNRAGQDDSGLLACHEDESNHAADDLPHAGSTDDDDDGEDSALLGAEEEGSGASDLNAQSDTNKNTSGGEEPNTTVIDDVMIAATTSPTAATTAVAISITNNTTSIHRRRQRDPKTKETVSNSNATVRICKRLASNAKWLADRVFRRWEFPPPPRIQLSDDTYVVPLGVAAYASGLVAIRFFSWCHRGDSKTRQQRAKKLEKGRCRFGAAGSQTDLCIHNNNTTIKQNTNNSTGDSQSHAAANSNLLVAAVVSSEGGGEGGERHAAWPSEMMTCAYARPPPPSSNTAGGEEAPAFNPHMGGTSNTNDDAAASHNRPPWATDGQAMTEDGTNAETTGLQTWEPPTVEGARAHLAAAVLAAPHHLYGAEVVGEWLHGVEGSEHDDDDAPREGTSVLMAASPLSPLPRGRDDTDTSSSAVIAFEENATTAAYVHATGENEVHQSFDDEDEGDDIGYRNEESVDDGGEEMEQCPRPRRCHSHFVSVSVAGGYSVEEGGTSAVPDDDEDDDGYRDDGAAVAAHEVEDDAEGFTANIMVQRTTSGRVGEELSFGGGGREEGGEEKDKIVRGGAVTTAVTRWALSFPQMTFFSFPPTRMYVRLNHNRARLHHHAAVQRDYSGANETAFMRVGGIAAVAVAAAVPTRSDANHAHYFLSPDAPSSALPLPSSISPLLPLSPLDEQRLTGDEGHSPPSNVLAVVFFPHDVSDEEEGAADEFFE